MRLIFKYEILKVIDIRAVIDKHVALPMKHITARFLLAGSVFGLVFLAVYWRDAPCPALQIFGNLQGSKEFNETILQVL